MGYERFKILILLAIIILVGLNIWLLLKNNKLTEKIIFLHAQLIHDSESLPVIRESIYISGLGNDELPLDLPFFLVTIFSDYGCMESAKKEIKWLNKLYDDYPDLIRVYYKGDNSSFFSNLGAEFDYQNIDPTTKLLNIPLLTSNPVSMITDKNKMVQVIHTNNTNYPGSERRRDLFYIQIKSLFQSVYSQY